MKRFSELKPILIISGIYLVLILLMLPLRNVSFDDDFAYIQTTTHLFQTGKLQISEWSAATLIFQAYWGAIFLRIFGLAITSLHIANIVIFYIALIFFYLILRKIKLLQKTSLLFTILLLSNPWIFNFLFTFMTDITYLSLMIISIYFFVSGIINSHTRWFLFGSFFAGFSFLTRQTGVFLGIGILFVLFHSFLTSGKVQPKIIFASLAPILAIFILYQGWTSKVGITATQYQKVYLPVQRDVLPHLFPSPGASIRAVNGLYLEDLIQRFAGYINSIVPFLVPVILLYHVSVRALVNSIKKHYRSVLTISLVAIFFYAEDYILKSKFSQLIPANLFQYSPYLNLSQTWPILIKAGVVVLVIFLSVKIPAIYSMVFANKRLNETSKKMFNIFVLIALTTLFYLTIKSVIYTYPQLTIYNPAGGIASYLKIDILNEALKNSWFPTIILSLTVIFIVNSVFYKKLNKLTNMQEVILFLAILLSLHLASTLFLAYYFWPEYIIPFLPLVLILLAYANRNLRINASISVIIVLIMLFISLSSTRNRYQIEGARWETAQKLVSRNIDPYQISEINWAWRPYWYFESSFKEKEKAVGDKYKINPITTWNQGEIYKNTYDIVAVASNQYPNNTSLVSESFWTFFQNKKVVAYKP